MPHAQAVALGAHAEWAVEAEELGRRRFVADAAMRAGVLRTVTMLDGGRLFGLARPLPALAAVGGRLLRDHQRSRGELEGRLDRIGESRAGDISGHQAIDDHLDGVSHLAVESQIVGELNRAAIDARPQKALASQVLEQVLVFPLLLLNHGGQELDPRPLGNAGDVLDDLFDGLGRDLPPAVRAEPRADPGEEHPQVVVDLGDRADGAAGIASAGLLLDRDRRRQATDRIDLGLGHLAEKLAGVAGQRLDVPSLSLGIQRVESERALSGAAHAGHADEPVARQAEVDVSQVMLAGSANDDVGSRHTCETAKLR